jgi:hypothetical protein
VGEIDHRADLHDRVPEHLHSGVLQRRGENESVGFLEAQYPAGAVAFYEMLARWREQGDFDGLIVE